MLQLVNVNVDSKFYLTAEMWFSFLVNITWTFVFLRQPEAVLCNFLSFGNIRIEASGQGFRSALLSSLRKLRR